MIKRLAIAGLAALVMACSAPAEQKKTMDPAGTYCIRRLLTAENAEGTDTSIDDNYGSGFVIEQEDDSTLVATAKHVVTENILSPPTGYTITNIQYFVVDNERDKNQKDDVELKPVSVNGEDVAILRSETPLVGTEPDYCNGRVGGVSYVIGYPYAMIKALTRGTISSSPFIFGNTNVMMNDTHVAKGMSGGPAYTITDTGACVYGVAVGITHDSLFSLTVPSKHLSDLEKELLETPDVAKKKFEHAYPNIANIESENRR